MQDEYCAECHADVMGEDPAEAERCVGRPLPSLPHVHMTVQMLHEAGAGDRLAALRAALPHRTGDLPRFSVAAGIAHLEPGADPKTALEAADRRLAAGKLKGRSR